MKKWLSFAAAVVLCGALFAEALPADAAEQDRFVNTETYISDLSMAPSIIAEIRAQGQAEGYAALEKEMRPSNAVVSIDKDLNALDAKGNAIGAFADLFETLASNGVLTVVRLNNKQEADALSAWLALSEEFDLAAMSADLSVVKYLKTTHGEIRGVADYSAKTVISDPAALVKEANENYCNAVLLSQSAADAEIVSFVQARFKAVWLVADSAEEFNFHRCVSSGAYGIVSDGAPETLYGYLDAYTFNSIPRAYLNIAHRGIPYGYPENTLESCIAAYEAGADAIEIDMKVSKDGEIFILHDSDLARTTNGTGVAENMRLQQLRNYKVTKDHNGADTGMAVDIPTLDEIFEYFKETEGLIVCEIKTTNPDIARLFSEKVKEYGMYGKVVAISFFFEQLGLMKETDAGIPTAYLGGLSDGTAGRDLRKLCANNTAVDAVCDPAFFWERNLKNRGFVNFSWTYDKNNALLAIQTGVTGITNNVAAMFGKYQKKILPRGAYSLASAKDLKDAAFSADILYGDRTKKERECSVFRYEISDAGANVILRYKENDFIIYSEPIFVRIRDAQKGCGAQLAANAIPAAAFTALSLLLLRKKRA